MYLVRLLTEIASAVIIYRQSAIILDIRQLARVYYVNILQIFTSFAFELYKNTLLRFEIRSLQSFKVFLVFSYDVSTTTYRLEI